MKKLRRQSGQPATKSVLPDEYIGEGVIEGMVVKGRASFTCPFCGGKITAASEPKKNGVMIVMHSTPPCEKYVQEEALVFLRNARVAAFGRALDDDEWPVGPTGDQGNN